MHQRTLPRMLHDAAERFGDARGRGRPRWAHQRMAPQGKSAPAEGSMPAGIELFGVAPLGIGLLDGDRLVSIGGAPVSERSQVVEHVLAARGRREDRIEVGLLRRTQAGPVAFSVTVNQPYSDTDTTPVSAEPVSAE